MTVAYDGTDYAGFQVQVGQRTIQEALETAISRVTGERARVDGAGRTDAGVHATAQVVSFRTISTLDTRTLRRGIDSLLPEDVAIIDLRDAPTTFHARFSARGRQYRYTIWNDSAKPVIERKYVYHWRSPLDDEAMARAAGELVGRHDFAAFCGTLRGRNRPTSTQRTIFRLHCWRDEPRVLVDASADSFLPQMVRNVVGTLLQIGMRNLAVSDLQGILAGRNRQNAGVVTAPARGLCLTRVWYD